MNCKVIGIIPARFASIRLPGKMLIDIRGKSLIQRTYENAKHSKLLDELVVATDDKKIFDHVLGFGGRCVMTGQHCLSGTDRLAEVINNYSEFSNFDIVVNIQGDEPLLNPKIIENCIFLLQDDHTTQATTAVIQMKSKEEAIDPSNVKCVIDKDCNALYFSRSLIPGGKNQIWSDKNTYYKHIGLYCYRKDFLLHYASLSPTPLQMIEELEQLKILENSYKMKVHIADEDSIGVDTPQDLIKVEEML